MTNGIRACSSSDTINADFGTFNPWYYPVTSPSSYPFHNPNFYHPDYTPPPTPPLVFHPPQPPPYYTPPTPYTNPYLPESNGIPWYASYKHEIQTQPNPYSPSLSCFMSQPVTTTQIPPGFIFGQQSELLAPQVFDESPDSGMPIFNAVGDTCHKMEDKYVEMIQILEKMGKSLAESSKILKGIFSKPVSQPSHTLNLVSNIDNLETSGLVKETLDVGSEDSNDLQLPLLNVSALHMFDEIPKKEYIDEKTFESCEDKCEAQRKIVDYSVGALDFMEKDEYNGDVLALDNVFVEVDSVSYENKEEIELKDIEDRKILKSQFSLTLSCVNGKGTLNEGGGKGGKVLEIGTFGTLKEKVKGDDMKGNGEESENVEEQTCKEQYMLPKIDGSNVLSCIVSEEKLVMFDPDGYKKKMNRSEKLRLNDVAIIVAACRILAVREDVGAKVKKWRDSHVIGFEVACKGVLTDKSMREAYVKVLQVVSYTSNTLQMGVGQDIPAAMPAIHASQRSKKLCLWGHVYLVGLEASEQVVLERMHNVLNLSQEHGHKLEELRRPGTQVYHIKAIVLFVNVQVNFREASLLYYKNCFKKAVDRKAELIIVRVYNLLNVGRKSSELVKNSLCLDAEFVYADWTFDYVIEVVFAEMNYIIKACKSQVKKWLSNFVVLFVRKKQLTYLYNVYIGLVIVTTKYNDDCWVVQTFKADGPFTFTRDVYCKVFRSGNYKEAVFSTYRVHVDQILVEIDVKIFFELECDIVCNKHQYLNKLVYSLIAGFQWSIKGGTLANGELYYILDQKLWHKYEKMQNSGGQLIIDTCSPDMLWNTTKAEPMEIKVYDLPYIGCKSSEAVKNSFYFDAELDDPDWTQDYVKVHVLYVEVIKFLKSYKYSLSRQSSPEMGMDFRNGKDLDASITSDKPIAYADVFQPIISSREGIKVQLLSLLDVTPLSLDMGIVRSVVTVFRLRNTIISTKKKQVRD